VLILKNFLNAHIGHNRRNDMTDYTEIESSKMAGVLGTDAMEWAKAFVQFKAKHDFVIDEDLMVGWFANAMEQSSPATLTDEEALHISARIWCRPECGKITMDSTLAQAFADVLQNGEDKSTLRN